MIIKTLFLASFVIACALASKDGPYPAALLVESNFDFSLTRKEFRVHYGGLKHESTQAKVFINIYRPNGKFSYELENDEKKPKNAFHFALEDAEDGNYEVEVCEDDKCSAKTPSLNNVIISNRKHKIFCEHKESEQPKIEVNFVEPTDNDWADDSKYKNFSKTINEARKLAGVEEVYTTDYEQHVMGKNPYYKKEGGMFHVAIMHDLKNYKDFFDKTKATDYCGRKNMLSLHTHIIKKNTRKVLHRLKTVNHLSKSGEALFILGSGGPILLESTHKGVEIEDGDYEIWVSLCVTDKDTVESTYCANPITKNIKVADGVLTSS